MDVGSGTSSPRPGPSRLRAVPPGRGDLQDDLALLRDAATLMTARTRLDGLLLQLTTNPFDPAAYRGLGSYLAGPGVLALAAYERVSAATTAREL